MVGYLAYLGLQRVKTTRIQKFSKEYVEKEWTYITELCGVGK
jgi:methyl-CpG-binding domain protein 4